MAEPRVRWTESAVRDLEVLVAFVAQESPERAERLVELLRSKVEGLAPRSSRGRIVPELAHFGIATFRELLVKPNRIGYRISDREVIILAILDGRRDLEDLRLERLLREP